MRLIGGAETIQAHATYMHETDSREREIRTKESHQPCQLINYSEPKRQTSRLATDTVRTS